jgi:hypothetical protein
MIRRMQLVSAIRSKLYCVLLITMAAPPGPAGKPAKGVTYKEKPVTTLCGETATPLSRPPD